MITKAVLVFWVSIVVVGEYITTFERKQLSLSGVYIYTKEFIRCHFPGQFISLNLSIFRSRNDSESSQPGSVIDFYHG
jgi:hypothetical protein